jgi:hypothetical protein
VNNATKLREILGDVVDSSVEVGVVARGGVFFGDELRREATSMKIGEFLDLLDQPTDIPSKHDFYLLQCPFLSCSPSNVSLPLSPLAAVFKVPACANGVGDVDGNLWACHRDAITSAHFDGRDNILTVLKGSKEVKLPASPLFALVHDCMCCCVSICCQSKPFLSLSRSPCGRLPKLEDLQHLESVLNKRAWMQWSLVVTEQRIQMLPVCY